MAGNTFGQVFRVTTWGESHGTAIGATIDGCPAGIPLTPEDIQVDLDRRIHRNQDTKALGKMAFVILKTFLNRIEKLGLIELNKELFYEMIQYNLIRSEYKPDIYTIKGVERPPMIEVSAYREKFEIAPPEQEMKGSSHIAEFQTDRSV